MWLDNLKELKKAKGMSTKQIADATNLPERTVNRIFSGDTDNPYVDTLHRIVSVLGGSLDNILTDTKTVVGSTDLITLQDDIDRLNNEATILQAENAVLKDKVSTLTAENDMLRMKLEHKEEIISLHNYYIKLKPNN
jgi:transcriptional regulator with XRE-family HTH domain